MKDVVLQWGVIGPRRLFSHGQLYFGLIFFFLAGILAPLFQWILHKKFRIGFLKYINFPVVFGSASFLPPATPLNYVPGVFVCFIFNYIIRRRNFDWWAKYNCESLRGAVIGFLTRDCPRFSGWVTLDLLSAGLDTGRLYVWSPHHLLYFAIPEKWHDWPRQHSELVGQYRLQEDGRLYGSALQEPSRRWKVRSVELVEMLCRAEVRYRRYVLSPLPDFRLQSHNFRFIL